MIKSGKATADDVKVIARLLGSFVFHFNRRLVHKMPVLEAFTVFDPRPQIRRKNRRMLNTYLTTLLDRYKMPRERALEFDAERFVLMLKSASHETFTRKRRRQNTA